MAGQQKQNGKHCRSRYPHSRDSILWQCIFRLHLWDLPQYIFRYPCMFAKLSIPVILGISLSLAYAFENIPPLYHYIQSSYILKCVQRISKVKHGPISERMVERAKVVLLCNKYKAFDFNWAA